MCTIITNKKIIKVFFKYADKYIRFSNNSGATTISTGACSCV